MYRVGSQLHPNARHTIQAVKLEAVTTNDRAKNDGATSNRAGVSSPSKDATSHTIAKNTAEVFTPSVADFERARRGKIATHTSGRIDAADGSLVWDIARHDFLRNDLSFDEVTTDGPTHEGTAESRTVLPSDPIPHTVNPSLWRHAQLDAIHGLFEVAPDVWQVRGYDISNITFIASNSGWIVIDPLTTEATARASLDLVSEHLGKRDVVAVIYTHSHADHFGGVLGVTSQVEVDAGRCQVIAPAGFLYETAAENVIGGPAMARRAAYQFGPLLPPGPRGHVDSGLGIAIPFAQSGLIAPTRDITHTGEELIVDGVRIIFQMTPETEAPAEMNFFFPDHGWLCMAENCSQTMHNLVPIRGTQVRDALAWSKYIGEAIELFGDRIETMFTSHHWPRWGNADVRDFLTLQRDLYRWMHDQTMRYANHGLTPLEIAELLELPSDFASQSHTRGYYGHLVHNVKAVYQRYLSWYDGNPARLHQHPPIEVGKRYVAFMGGAEALLENARKSFDEGDYRWVAEVVNHLVFADPTNSDARHLQADALEQLGYQTESSTFRNAYLMGAQELRHGSPPARPVARRGLLQALSIELIFEALAVRLKSEEVVGERTTINFRFTDISEDWILGLNHCVLHTIKGRHDSGAAATITMTRASLLSIMSGDLTFVAGLTSGEISFEGDVQSLSKIFGHLDTFQSGFNIIEP
jgi:alkyl sulfatase BDS1-like metallo-beta-lactamase superfamily hydrolase